MIECKKEDISELEFKTAVNQAFSYAITEGAKFVWITSGIKDEYYQVPKRKPKDRITIVDIPSVNEKFVPKYKYVKADPKYHEIEIVSEDNLTKRFKQAHNALWAGGELNPSEAFDELDKLIFCKIWDERNCKRKEPYKFQVIPFIEIDKDGDEVENKKLTNKNLFTTIERTRKECRVGNGEYFWFDIEGCKVIEDGKVLGIHDIKKYIGNV